MKMLLEHKIFIHNQITKKKVLENALIQPTMSGSKVTQQKMEKSNAICGSQVRSSKIN